MNRTELTQQAKEIENIYLRVFRGDISYSKAREIIETKLRKVHRKGSLIHKT